MDSFRDTALLLIGHGSTKNVESCRPTYQHAATLRAKGLFAEVHEAFWKQPPFIRETLEKIRAPRIVIVPLFISEGYFTEEMIPLELGLRAPDAPDFSRSQVINGKSVCYAAPVGTHPGMTELLLARAEEIVRKHPFPRAPKPADIALFIAGHGTPNNDNSRKAIEKQVELIRALNRYGEVHAIFMEEDPKIGACYDMTKLRNIVIVPFFISDGLHSYEDIPMMLGEPERIVQSRMAAGQPTWRNPTERKGKLVWYTLSIGNEPQMIDVILQRAREAAAGAPPQI